MIRYLHTLSAFFFYLLGSSFFLAYVLLHNGIAVSSMNAWLNIGDMPLLLCGMMYGGLSVYGSVKNDAHSSKTLMLGIGIPLLILFILFVFLNFR